VENYHAGINRTLKHLMNPHYQKYRTYDSLSGTLSELKENTARFLKTLSDIALEIQNAPVTDVAGTKIRNEIEIYFAAQARVMGQNTAEAQILGQATDFGTAIQHVLFFTYLAGIAIDVHSATDVFAATAHGNSGLLTPIESGAKILEDVGKTPSLLSSFSASLGRWTTEKWPFKPEGWVKQVEQWAKKHEWMNMFQGFGAISAGIELEKSFHDSIAQLQSPVSHISGLEPVDSIEKMAHDGERLLEAGLHGGERLLYDAGKAAPLAIDAGEGVGSGLYVPKGWDARKKSTPGKEAKLNTRTVRANAITGAANVVFNLLRDWGHFR
jgi:hypothetical protein